MVVEILDGEQERIMAEEYAQEQALKSDYMDSVIDSMSIYELRKMRD